MADAAGIWMALEEQAPARPAVCAAALLSAFAAWKQGDAGAFETVVEHLHPTAHRVALRLLGNRQDAEDAVQETFWRLYRAGEAIRNPESLPGWLYRTTVNMARNKHKQRSRADAVALERVEWQRSDGRMDAANTLLLREELHRALAQLGEKEREAVVLRDVEGLEIAEVAAAMGVFAVTVRTHLSRGRLKMQQILRARGIRP
jgi:RNA polymerase sigma-70 factor (ECF subfamily)